MESTGSVDSGASSSEGLRRGASDSRADRRAETLTDRRWRGGLHRGHPAAVPDIRDEDTLRGDTPARHGSRAGASDTPAGAVDPRDQPRDCRSRHDRDTSSGEESLMAYTVMSSAQATAREYGKSSLAAIVACLEANAAVIVAGTRAVSASTIYAGRRAEPVYPCLMVEPLQHDEDDMTMGGIGGGA